MKKIISIFFMITASVSLSGCFSDFVRQEEFQVLEASNTRRMNKLNYDLNVTKGATNENRAEIEVLQQQIQEISNRLGIINKNITGVDKIETKFNSKIKNMMQEVVKENKRLIKEINKTRETVTDYSSDNSENNINIYQKSANADLDTGYYHTVKSGESLSKIAKKYQVPIGDIIAANELNDPDNLKKGQKLFIPDPGE